MPLIFPWSFPKAIKSYLNGRLLSHIPIAASGWYTYTFQLSQSDLTGGSMPSALPMFPRNPALRCRLEVGIPGSSQSPSIHRVCRE